MLKKTILGLALGLALTVFVSFNFMPGGSAIADNLNPAGMTYEGIVNPLEAIDANVYKPFKFMMASGGYVIWSQAVDVNRQPAYIAVFVFGNKAVVITYYYDKQFYQVALTSNESTHLEMMETTDAQRNRYQRDFTAIFGVPFPLIG